MKYFFLLSAKNTKPLGHKLVLIEPALKPNFITKEVLKFISFKTKSTFADLQYSAEATKSTIGWGIWLSMKLYHPIINSTVVHMYRVVRIVYTLQYILLF